MADAIGYAALQIIPSLKGLDANLKGTLITPLMGAGKKAGEAYADGLESAKARVEKASSALAKARDKEADAAGRVRVAETQLQTLRSRGVADAGRLAAAEERTAAARRKSVAATKEATAANKSLSDATSKVQDFASRGQDAGGGMGDGFMGGFKGKIGSLAAVGGPIALAVSAVGAIGIAAGGALAIAIGVGMQKEVKQDLIQAKLGVNEETAARIGGVAGKAYANNFGESAAANMDAASAAIKTGLLSGEETAPEIQKTIERLTTLSDIMGVDVVQSAQAAGQMVKLGLAANATEAFDLLTVGAQKAETSTGDLVNVFTQRSATLKQFGLDGATSIGIFNQAIDAGAPSADYFVGALEELAGNAGNEAEAFETLGLNAQEMATKLTGGGDSAKTALDQLLDSLRNTDPITRSNAMIALFGEEATAMQEALLAVDPSTAVEGLGQVAGAAQNAADVIGDNAASKIESAKRDIEQSMSGVKVALADAFGPTLEKVAGWVETHQPEIIGFFQGLGNAAFDFLDAALAVSAGALRAFADMIDGIGGSIATGLQNLGGFTSAIGGLVSKIPGMQSVGDELQSAGDKATAFGEGIENTADGARNLADSIMNEGRPALQNMQDDFNRTTGQAIVSAEQMRLFGGAVEQVPDSKDVHVQALTDEAKRLVEEFGLKVTTLEDGSVIIHADTKPGQDEIDRWIGANQNRQVDVTMLVTPQMGQPANNDAWPQILRPVPNASGGLVSGPGGPTDDRILSLLSNGEFVVKAAQTRKHRGLLEAINGGMRGFAGGGYVDPNGDPLTPIQASMWEEIKGKFPSAVLTDGPRPGANDFHGAGKAIDIAGPDMGAMNKWIAGKYPGALELFYDPGINIDEGKRIGAIDGHGDHVHWAMSSAVSGGSALDSQEPGAAMQAVAPATTEEDRVADAIIAEGRRRGMSDKAIKIALAVGLAESGLRNLEGGDRDSVGVFQQRDNGAWGTREDRMDPTRSAGMFYDELAKQDYENMAPEAAGQAVQRSAFSSGSNYAAQLGKADEILARRGGAAAPGSASTPPDSAAGQGQPVFVTNWPSGWSGGTMGGDGASIEDYPATDSFTPGGSAAPEAAATETVDVEGRTKKAGEDFLTANATQFGSDLGYSGNGAIPTAIREGLAYGANFTVNAVNVDEAVRKLMINQRQHIQGLLRR